MLDEIDAVLAATKNSSAEEIMDDYLKRRAVERAIQIISEAAKELPPEVRAEEPDVPWASIIAIGNYLDQNITGSRWTSCIRSWRSTFRSCGPPWRACWNVMATGASEWHGLELRQRGKGQRYGLCALKFIAFPSRICPIINNKSTLGASKIVR